jgi:hypothetical protein
LANPDGTCKMVCDCANCGNPIAIAKVSSNIEALKKQPNDAAAETMKR